MNELEIIGSSPEAIKASFTRIAGKPFRDYQLEVNASYTASWILRVSDPCFINAMDPSICGFFD